MLAQYLTAARNERGFNVGAAKVNPKEDQVIDRFFVSDVPSRFEVNGIRFLGRPLGPITLVEQSDLPWYSRRFEPEKGAR